MLLSIDIEYLADISHEKAPGVNRMFRQGFGERNDRRGDGVTGELNGAAMCRDIGTALKQAVGGPRQPPRPLAFRMG